MTRKLKVNTKAVPDGLTPMEPATLDVHFGPLLSTSSDQEDKTDDVFAEDKGGIVSLTVGGTTISGDTVRTASPKDLKRIASSASKAPDDAKKASVSPGKRSSPSDMNATQQVMHVHAETINQLIDRGRRPCVFVRQARPNPIRLQIHCARHTDFAS